MSIHLFSEEWDTRKEKMSREKQEVTFHREHELADADHGELEAEFRRREEMEESEFMGLIAQRQAEEAERLEKKTQAKEETARSKDSEAARKNQVKTRRNEEYASEGPQNWGNVSVTPDLEDDGMTRKALTVAPPEMWIHSNKISALDLPLDLALSSFETSISPWNSPYDWDRENNHHISSIVQGITMLVGATEVQYVNFAQWQNVIYPRAIVYIFVHLTLCVVANKTDKEWPAIGHVEERQQENSVLGDFKQFLTIWKDWDSFMALKNHRAIKETLWNIFQRGLSPLDNRHYENLFETVIAVDTIGLASQLTMAVMDKGKLEGEANMSMYRKLLHLKGDEAQVILDLLQARLEMPIDPLSKARHVKLLIHLSKKSGLYPECLILESVQIEGDAVASGSFGEVYRGRLGGQEIAVKILRVFQKSDMEKLLREFSCEAVIWRQLTHQNILPFYGVYRLDRNPPRVCFVCPWMENGNLVSYLSERAPATNCVPIMLDIAQGLSYLHSVHIIHGDLKGVNILITPSGRACLADFGLASSGDSKSTLLSTMSTSGITGTLRWQAPELFPDWTSEEEITDPSNTKATDIYAYAVTCWEMFSGDKPWLNFSKDMHVMVAVAKGRRPSRPTQDSSMVRGLNDEIWGIIESCWAQDPTDRPAAVQIVERILASFPDHRFDERHLDNFDMSFSCRVRQAKPANP